MWWKRTIIRQWSRVKIHTRPSLRKLDTGKKKATVRKTNRAIKEQYCFKIWHMHFVEEMKPLCGKVWTIRKVYWASTNETYYEIVFDNVNLDWDYLFTKEMFDASYIPTPPKGG